MSMRIVRNAAGNCINFVGSSNPVYWNACLSAQVNSTDTSTIDVINDIRTLSEGTTQYEFYQMPYTEFLDEDGNGFSSATNAAQYITDKANVASNTGQFVLSATDTMDFELDDTGTSILVDNGDAYAVNAIRATANDDGHINILQHTGDVAIFSDLRVANATINGSAVNTTLATAVNELNSLFQQTGGASGSAPAITSSTTVNLTEGDTLNYELTATNGVGYEWSDLPSGITTVDGNTRKLVGGSALAAGTYNITAKAINYFGEDSETISLVVSTPPFSNTKSIQFSNSDWMGANASLLDATLGRSGNGSGSGEAWSIAFWFKASTDSSGQTVFYYGSNDVTNGGHMEIRFIGGTDKLRLRYGSNNNFLQLVTPNNSLTPNTWQHVVITYDGNTTGASSGSINTYYGRFAIYIDGVAQTTSNTHGNYGWSGSISGQNLRIGRYASGNYMKGCKVEEFAVWNSNQASNIADIYNSGSTHDLSALTDSPEHYWRMGDGDMYPTIQDNVGSAHFVMYNMTAADIVTDAP